MGIQKHPDVPVILIHCQDVKKVPQPSGVQSWIVAPLPVGAPAVPMLGASTVAHTTRGSPSITAFPPDEGVVLADVDSVLQTCSDSGLSTSPIAQMLLGSTPCELWLMLLDAKLGIDGFHDIIIENLTASPTWRWSHISPANITALRRRWPKDVFRTLIRRAPDVERLRRDSR